MREIRPFGRAIDLYEYEHRGKKQFFKGLPRPKQCFPQGLEWMDNKGKLRKRFPVAGIPMAKGGVGRTWEEVKTLFHELLHPVITKPNIGSRGRHTTTRIETEEELRVGFDKAKRLSPWIIVEQEFIGTLYRVLLIDGRVVAVLRRDRAHVLGNGSHTIRELVNAENQNPRRNPSVIVSEANRSYHDADNEFCPLPTDATATEELSRQGHTWNSVPQKNNVVYVSRKPSRSVGGSTTDVLAETHSENIKLFEWVAKTVNDPLIGVDFFIGDMSVPWNTQACAGVIECNSLPFIDLHHYPLYGPVRDAAGALWDAVLKKN
jgi:cyanophycin synthetase